MRSTCFVLLLVIGGLTGCVKAPSYPIEPHIEFKSVSRTNVVIPNGSTVETLENDTITFSFTDGDGDISTVPDSTDTLCFSTSSRCGLKNGDTSCLRSLSRNIFLIDHRDSCFTVFASADISPDERFPGLSGEISVLTHITPVCFPPYLASNCPPDSVVYSILIKDRAGHLSNTIQTPRISIRVQ